MIYDLIIAEKPSAARKIAAALAEGPVKDVKVGQVSYHQLKRKGKEIVVVPAVGHLFGLSQKTKNWTYPVFDIEWRPTYETSKGADYAKKYADVIKKVAKDANEFTVATDLDVEGETIAFNILRFLCNQKDAHRMKFSTLTKPELQAAYDKKLGHLFHGLAEAGVTRHTLDWIWGINFSRALTLAVKAAGRYKVLSIGRVQGPALNFLAQRERDIQAFVPTPFWQLEADHGEFVSLYENEKIEKKEDADRIFSETKDARKAKVSKVDRKEYNHNPPTPFNLTDLQKEAFGVMGVSPKETQEIAQVLYENAYISYPRTSVDYDETIFVIDAKNRVKEVKIGEFVDGALEKAGGKIVLHEDSEELEGLGFKTFSVNLETNKVETRPITSLIRHPITEPLFEITMEDGRSVRITKSHSVFIFDDGKLKSIPTAELSKGDYVAVPKSIPFSSRLDKINVLEEIIDAGQEENFTLVNWEKNSNLLSKTFGKGKQYALYRWRHTLPSTKAMQLVAPNEIMGDTQVMARSGKNGFVLSVGQQVTPELARVLGYFASEGNKWEVKGPKANYEINLTQNEGDVLEDMQRCLSDVTGQKITAEKHGNGKKLRVYGKSASYLLALYGVDGESTTKQAPCLIYSSEDTTVAEYLKAYFAGDGCVDTPTKSIRAFTVSRNLANGIVFLLLRLGIFARIQKSKGRKKQWNTIYKIIVSGKENVERFAQIVGFVKERHKTNAESILCKTLLPSLTRIDSIPRYLVNWKELSRGIEEVLSRRTAAHKTRYITKQQLRKMVKMKESEYAKRLLQFVESDVGLSRIVSIREVPPTRKHVYDLSIDGEKYENFIGGFGSVVLHNSSQKLPAALGLKLILEKLAQQPKYASLIQKVLKNSSKPNEGEKTDDAHPAIHPTGEVPELSKLTAKQAKVYDLIAKRFIACFGDPAKRESLKVALNLNGHLFNAEGKTTKERNWYELYEPYVKLKDVQLPDLKEGQEVDVTKVDLLSKETQPPSRYNEASIISELEKKSLGTKATRAEIIDTLYRRGYLEAKRIEVTPLGLQVITTLEKYCPDIISEELTRRFEEEMEAIEHEKCKGEKTIDEAKTELTKIFTTFKSKEKDIGMSLLGSIQETQTQMSTLGPCPTCKVGTLMLRRSKFGQFVGCNKYPECKQTYPLPRDGLIQKTEEICDKCGTPFVKVIRKGKKPWMMCLSTTCPTKAEWNAKREEYAKQAAAKKISQEEAKKLGGTEVETKPAKKVTKRKTKKQDEKTVN